ncbi:MAG TPA: hypothetical protein VMR37_07450 [Rhabdochlamydiaceae bacterium]|nr:hypothetical protein [Rhabdochlamydiaceae bacterium]
MSVALGSIGMHYDRTFVSAAKAYVQHTFKDVSLGLGGNSLVNRAVLLSAGAFTITTVFLQVIGQKQERGLDLSEERIKRVVYGVLAVTVAAIASAAGCHFIIASLAFASFVQLNKTLALSPLNSRVYRAVYQILKYAALLAFTLHVFEACNKNSLNGPLLLGTLHFLSLLAFQPGYFADNTADQPTSSLKRTIGWHVGFGLIFTAILCGMGQSELWRGGKSIISGIKDHNLYSCLQGVRGISFVIAFILPNIKEMAAIYDTIDHLTSDFIQRFSYGIFTAIQVSSNLKMPLSKPHFEISYDLTVRFLRQKTDPSQSQFIMNALKDLDPDARLMHLLENYPFLDAQQRKEFIEQLKLQSGAAKFLKILNQEQIQHLLLPAYLVPQLNSDGLEAIKTELNTLEAEVDGIVLKYAEEKSEKERKIYEEIQKKLEKVAEYAVPIGLIFNLLNNIPPGLSNEAGAQAYILSLRNLQPRVEELNQKLLQLDAKMENYCGNFALSIEEGLGAVGLRVSDCKDILEEFQIVSSEPAIKVVGDLLRARGVKNNLDLWQKGILAQQNGQELINKRLCEFISKNKDSTSSSPPPASSWREKAARTAYFAQDQFSYFLSLALRFYYQPRWTAAAVAWGVLAPRLIPHRFDYPSRSSVIAIGALMYLRNELQKLVPSSPFYHEAVSLLMRTQLMMLHASRVGFIFAGVLGITLPAFFNAYFNVLRNRFRASG